MAIKTFANAVKSAVDAVRSWASANFLTYGEVGKMFDEYKPRLVDGSVSTQKLADGSVTSAKIAEDAVTADGAAFYLGNWEVTPPNILENECGILLESYRVRPTNSTIRVLEGWNRYYIAIPVYGYGQGFVVPSYANIIVDDVVAVKVALKVRYHPSDYGYVESSEIVDIDTKVTLSNDSVIKFKFYDASDVEVPMVGKPCRVAWLRNTQKDVWYQPNIPGIIEYVNGYTDAGLTALESRVDALEARVAALEAASAS